MNGKKHVNQFDLLVERLAAEFLKIPNFDLIQNENLSTQLYNTVIYRIADISSYKNLIAFHFVPAANKAIFDGIQNFRTSKYKHLVKIDESMLKETLYSTLRFSYVSLFHKFESFIDELLGSIDTFMYEGAKPEMPLEKYIKSKFDFNIRHWNQFPVLYKINWISNCTKHKDGYPLKEPVPHEFTCLPKNERIKLSVEDFKVDCDALLAFCPLYFKILFMFSQYQVFFDKEDLEGFSEEYLNTMKLHKNIIRGQMISMISSLKMGFA